MPDRGDADPQATPTLVRQVGVGGLALTVVNVVLGVGVFGLPGLVAAEIGSAAVLAYLACGALAAAAALCSAEAVTRVPESGGIAAAAQVAFGPVGGSVVGTLLWFAAGALASSAISVLLLNTLGTIAPVLAVGPVRVAALALVYAVLAWANVRGVRRVIEATAVVSVFKLAPLILLIVVGLWRVDPAKLAITSLPSPGRFGSTVLLLFFAFQGTETGLSASGETVRPGRTIPLGVGLGLGMVGLLYLGLQTVGQGVLGEGLARSTDAPLVAIAEALVGSMGLRLIVFATVMSVLGILIVDTLVTPRVLFALGDQGLMPRALARVHPVYRTPHLAIIAYCAIAFALAASGTFRQLILFSAGGTLLANAITALAVLRLRRTPEPAHRSGFRIPGGALVPLLTVLVVAGVLATLKAAEIGALVLLSLVGALPAWRLRRLPGHRPGKGPE